MSSKKDEDDEEVEEWFDFSRSGEWEKMIADLECIFREEWNLVNTTTTQDVTSKTRTFSFRSRRYVLSLHGSKGARPPEIDEASLSLAALWMMDRTSDFNIEVHEITRWFGVRDFLLCKLVKSKKESDLTISRDTARQLLSSICLALSSCDACIPVFVIIDDPQMGKRLGTCRPSPHQGVSSTEFECDMVMKVPRKYNHMDGLMELFKSKIRYRRSVAFKFKPSMDVRYTWMMDCKRPRRWGDDSLIPDLRWRRGPIRSFSGTSFSSSRWTYVNNGLRLLEGSDFDGVPICGDVNDPLRSIHVSSRWPTFRDGQVADNSVYSDFRKMITEDLSNDSSSSSSKMNALWNIRANWNQVMKTPLTNCVRGIMRLTCENLEKDEEVLVERDDFLNVQSVLSELFTTIKSREARHDEPDSCKSGQCACAAAPAGSFLSIMTMRIMDAWSFADASGVTLNPTVLLELWTGITRKIRERWQSRRLIPRIFGRRRVKKLKRIVHESCCLLHQKLELINICIDTENRRRRRKHYDHDDYSEDFFSAEEESEENEDTTPSTPPPMTSDVLEEQRRILNFPKDSKAVVPHTHCIRENMNRFRASSKSRSSSLKDFVTWQIKHLNLSRDDEVDAFQKTMTGDFWKEIWNNAVKTKQRLAFDPQREAERALQWIESLSFREVARYVTLVSIHTAAHILEHSSTPACELPIVKRSLREVRNQLCENREIPDEKFVLNTFNIAEKRITMGTSLFHRLPRCTRLVTELLRKSDQDSSTQIFDKDELVSVWSLCQIISKQRERYDDDDDDEEEEEEEKVIASHVTPDVREVIIRALTRRTTLGGGALTNSCSSSSSSSSNDDILCVHRMYTLLHKNEFRMALAVSDSEY